ncbi:hypothetical protein TCAL_15562 [Tigriopus californicus]|uniref:N-acetyltransferase domain-containing protein n=1 Tax=Tigriopus californicus TaxID=6832 RepID=A0A553PCV4_TIGCA|nr:uncharacterized protein LOC131892700 [Tigriopus californicus]TRY75527.1 hypothetical protein TCAL_15562 [Tigriopus californicus]
MGELVTISEADYKDYPGAKILINRVQALERDQELRAQIRAVFGNRHLWFLCLTISLIICQLIGTSSAFTASFSYWIFLYGLFYGSYWPPIEEIFNQNGVDLYDLGTYYATGDPKRLLLVAKWDHRVVGTLAFRESSDDKTVKLWRMFVDPEFRRKGIASLLIDILVKVAKARVFKKIQLRTHGSNRHGIACYLKNGFELAGESIFSRILHIEYSVIEMELDLAIVTKSENHPN